MVEKIDRNQKNQYDYGDIRRIRHLVPHIEPLSLAESHLIGRFRMYGSIINQTTQRTLKGHIIAFAHDGPQQNVTSVTMR